MPWVRYMRQAHIQCTEMTFMTANLLRLKIAIQSIGLLNTNFKSHKSKTSTEIEVMAQAQTQKNYLTIYCRKTCQHDTSFSLIQLNFDIS